MQFSIASLGLFLAVIGSVIAAPATEAPPVQQVARRNTECGQDFNGAKTCSANCADGSCHVIALGPLHQCKC